jgi:hypothetical protein
MARFLLDTDYDSIIKSADLAQITEGVAQNLEDAEIKAVSRVRSKLIQRYMVDIELGTMTAYSAATHYRTKDRVLTGSVIDSVKSFDRWDNSTAYIIGNIVTDDNGYVYTSILGSTNKALTNTTYWSPMINIVNSNATYWDVAIDNRYPLFVECVMDLALHYLYARINPRLIPDLRRERYNDGMVMLDEWESGKCTAEVLETYTTQQGLSITYGSSRTKQSNFFY